MFTHGDGAPYHPAQVSARFARLAFYEGLPPIRLHGLRHGAATLALAAGRSMKEVSVMLQHSSESITSGIYASVLPELKAEVPSAVASMVPRKTVGGQGTRNCSPRRCRPARHPEGRPQPPVLAGPGYAMAGRDRGLQWGYSPRIENVLVGRHVPPQSPNWRPPRSRSTAWVPVSPLPFGVERGCVRVRLLLLTKNGWKVAVRAPAGGS